MHPPETIQVSGEEASATARRRSSHVPYHLPQFTHVSLLHHFPDFISLAPATATTANVPDVVNMAEAMFGNMDSVVPLGKPCFNHQCLVPGDDGDGEGTHGTHLRRDTTCPS